MREGLIFDGKYRILKMLGRGGMGSVYLAENIRLGTLWAIKAIAKRPDSKTDTLVEPNILKRLNHSALPRIFDIIEDEHNIYIIVDYIDGISLDKELEKSGKFPEDRVLDWGRQICDVLVYLHSQKPHPIIYRDMKPSNIILTGEGSIKLIDFGIAREYKQDAATDTVYIGTKGYAAPEQFGKGQTGVTTDIYSLGVTLHHLLTGKSPNTPPYDIKPVRLYDMTLSKEIEHIISKCTKQDPDERYQSVHELLLNIDDICKLKNNSNPEKAKKSKFIIQFPDDYKKVAGFSGDAASGVTTIAAAVSECLSRAGKKHAVVDLTTHSSLYEAFGRGYEKMFPKHQDACRNSLKDLLEGKLKPVKLDRFRDLYMSNTRILPESSSFPDLIDLLKSDNDIVLFEMDFDTDVSIIKHLSNLYLIKDMNMYNANKTVKYIKSLKDSLVNLFKLKIIINKHINTVIKPKAVVDSITAVPDETGEGGTEVMFGMPPAHYVVPFELENYRAAIEGIEYPYLTCENYTKVFKNAIHEITQSIYPLDENSNRKGRLKDFFNLTGKRSE